MAELKVPNLDTFMNYEYEVDLASDTAAAHIISMAGKNKKVLEIGAGSGSITRHIRYTIIAMSLRWKSTRIRFGS